MTEPNTEDSAKISTETAVALQRQLSETSSQLAKLHDQVEDHEAWLSQLENKIPNSDILNQGYLRRAFAVWGHVFVAGLIISVVIYGGVAIIALVFGGLGALLGS